MQCHGNIDVFMAKKPSNDIIFVVFTFQLMNIKKYLQQLHSRSSPAEGGVAGDGGEGEGEREREGEKKRLVLLPDVLLECDHLLLQLCEDPFEAKLRANYEVRG